MWECLLGFTFQGSQHKIDFGRGLGSILGGFGLHFGRFFGLKSEKVGFQTSSKRKAKNKKRKSHATNSDELRAEAGLALKGDSLRGIPQEAFPGR